ncbi:hypothetical protein [Kaistella faecalis]|uniref:hypothetical protein n=1 Tax=Kaistella faecalis TaxID=2852098 RepID=UPI001C477AE5|nr:hypothetical protein [Chryseobacterium faecale]UFK98034.1 hypothetical protein LL667_01450 [Chryseobacterium faecale]
MKKIFTLAVLLQSLTFIAQQRALTEDGKEVVLFDNGTWKFVNESDAKALETIITNNNLFEKSRNASFLMKSKKLDVGVYFDPKKWKLATQNISPHVEYFFTDRSNTEGSFGFMMTEKVQIATLKNLKELIIENVSRNVDFFRLKESEYRTVNGMKVLFIRYAANTKGMDFEYAGYYYINSDGYAGVVGFSSQKMFESNFDAIQELINGISLSPKQELSETIEYTSPPPPMKSK